MISSRRELVPKRAAGVEGRELHIVSRLVDRDSLDVMSLAEI